MDESFAAEGDGGVEDFAGAVDEEELIARLKCVAMPWRRDELAGEDLLIRIARQLNARDQPRCTGEAGAIDAEFRSAAEDIRRGEVLHRRCSDLLAAIACGQCEVFCG